MEQHEADDLYYSKLPNGVMPDAEGNYQWIYEADSRKNRSFLNLYLLIFGLIILIPGTILFFMIFGRQILRGSWYGVGNYLLIWLGILIGVELLVVLIYKLIEKLMGGTTIIPYVMGKDFIIVHPGNKLAPDNYLRTEFSEVKNISLDLKNELILLKELLRVTHVYVYREDIPFVLNYIIDRVPNPEKYESLRRDVNLKG